MYKWATNTDTYYQYTITLVYTSAGHTRRVWQGGTGAAHASAPAGVFADRRQQPCLFCPGRCSLDTHKVHTRNTHTQGKQPILSCLSL